jgi:hypothetical protein
MSQLLSSTLPNMVSLLFCTSSDYYLVVLAVMGYAVAQLVEALCYKREGCGFDSNGVSGSFDIILPAAL